MKRERERSNLLSHSGKIRRNDNYWVFAGFGYFQIHPWIERAFVGMRPLCWSERKGERHNLSSFKSFNRGSTAVANPVVGHGWVTTKPSRWCLVSLFLSLLNQKFVYLVLEFFCATILLYLRCHHIIGGCKTHVLCLNIS